MISKFAIFYSKFSDLLPLWLVIIPVSMKHSTFVKILQKSASPSKSTSSEASPTKSTGRPPISHRTTPPKPATRTKTTSQQTSTTAAKVKPSCLLLSMYVIYSNLTVNY